MVRIGLVTIGQSPRKDITDDLIKILPPEVELVEAGALDDLTLEEIKRKLSPDPGDVVYVTRLRDGTEVKVSKEKILDLMRVKIDLLDSKGVDIIAILCSGEFPEFKASVPILYPDKILKGIVSGVKYRGKTAVLIPAREQISYARDKWSPYLENPDIIAISPYTSTPEDFIRIGRTFKEHMVGFAVMDCMGYSLNHKRIIKQISPLTRIITSRGALARALSEMVDSLNLNK
ncbi:MAG: AroM family protein [Sulfolobales archaeon]